MLKLEIFKIMELIGSSQFLDSGEFESFIPLKLMFFSFSQLFHTRIDRKLRRNQSTKVSRNLPNLVSLPFKSNGSYKLKTLHKTMTSIELSKVSTLFI